MRRDVQEIFRATPHHKQVMMFSATLAKDIRTTCKKFMANVSRSSFLEIGYNLSKIISAFRDFRRRRNQIDTPWSTTTLCEA